MHIDSHFECTTLLAYQLLVFVLSDSVPHGCELLCRTRMNPHSLIELCFSHACLHSYCKALQSSQSTIRADSKTEEQRREFNLSGTTMED